MKPIARKNNLVVTRDTGELFIEDLTNRQAICLNPTSAYVWEKCDGNRGPEEIAREMGEELGVPVSERLVSYALSKLSEKHLVSFTGQFA